MSKLNYFLFFAIVFLWSTSWIAIDYQIQIPPTLSIFYRFAISAAILFACLYIWQGKKAIAPLPLKYQPHLIIFATCLFSINYMLFYHSAFYIPTGLIAVVFALSSIFNCINARILFAEPMKRNTIIGATLGIISLLFIFGPDIYTEIKQTKNFGNTTFGMSLCIIGTFLFSIGNMASRHLSQNNISIISACSWGMLYGTIILLAYIIATATPFTFPTTPAFLFALFYLSIFASVLGFTFYLTLVANIGSSKAAYSTVLYPIFAVFISAAFENYQLNPLIFIGLTLAIIGNIIMFNTRQN